MINDLTKKDGVPCDFKLIGVKREGFTDAGVEYFETCNLSDPDIIGYRITYDGRYWCEINYRTKAEAYQAIDFAANMFRDGVRHKEYLIQRALGIK